MIRMTGVFLTRTVVLLLAVSLAIPMSLGAAATTPAPTKTPEASAAPSKHVKTLQAAAKAGLLGEQYLAKKAMTDVEVTDALVALYPVVTSIDVKTLKPGEGTAEAVTYEALLDLVSEKKGALRDRKVSAYTMEKRLQAIVAAFAEAESAKSANGKETAAVMPAASAVSEADLKAVRESIEKVSAELADYRKAQEARLKDIEKNQADDRVKVAGAQDDLSLVRDNLDALQGNLKSLSEREAALEKKVESDGALADTQKREWSIMRKDIRDHSQDLSVLKQKVERLMAPEKQSATPLDRALSSKWVPGAAILLSLTAVVLSASK